MINAYTALLATDFKKYLNVKWFLIPGHPVCTFLILAIIMQIFETNNLTCHAITKNVAVLKSDISLGLFDDALMLWLLLDLDCRH